MSHKMLSEVCDEGFFLSMSTLFDSDSIVRAFLQTEYASLGQHMCSFFNKLPMMDGIDDETANVLVYARFSTSLERIAIALTKQYNPLHNVDVTEIETNSGTDSHTYGGQDDTSVTKSSQGVHYEQLHNSSLTSSSTFDNTSENDMKPVSKTEHQFETQQNTNGSAVSKVEYGKTLDMDYGREIERTKQGNIGVMPTQNLLQLEYNTRLRMTLFDAIIRATVTTLSCGVWED